MDHGGGQGPVRAAPKTVLVVKRAPGLLGLLRRLLHEERYRALRRAYQVVVGLGAERADELLRATRPDLLILDVPPGDAAAWAALDRIGGDPTAAGTPVLVCAAPGREVRARAAALRDRGCRILLRPFTADELLEQVRRLAG
jgi:DNA-binding response OmpR family regulator